MLGRLIQSADFERVLAAPPCARSAHFALHHVVGLPAALSKPTDRTYQDATVLHLSTEGAPGGDADVDNPKDRTRPTRWFGSVVPKRHARRAVTRNLVKRQMREAVRRHASMLAPGLWVLRLRAAFDVRRFASAASPALKLATRTELERVLASVARRH